MKKTIAAFVLALFSAFPVFAQEEVRGLVVDAKNEPIPGVRVEVVDRPEVVYTDIDGVYVINIGGPAKKLRFSYVGQKPLELKIKPDMTVKFGKGWGSFPHYRAFWDFTGGFGSGGKMNVQAGDLSITDIADNTLMFGFDTTWGCQINENLFVGLGVGVEFMALWATRYNAKEVYNPYRDMEFSGINFPVFAAARWDFDITKRTAPYVGLRIGYQFFKHAWEDGGVYDDVYYRYLDCMFEEYGNGNTLGVNPKDVSGFFLQPSVGMRTRLKNKRSFNIGLSYNIFMKHAFDAVLEERDPSTYDRSLKTIDMGSSVGGVLKLTFGFDW